MTVPWYEILLRTAVVYLVVLLLLRLAGKRELGQMTPFDLVVILVNIAVGRWGGRIPFLRRVVASEPTLLLRDGKPIQAHLDRERVDIEEIEMAAREHGIADLKEVTAAVLEEDGSISIIPKEGSRIRRTTRHLRQFKQR